MSVFAVGLVIATLFLSGCSTEFAKKAHETRRQLEQAAAHRAPKPEDPTTMRPPAQEEAPRLTGIVTQVDPPMFFRGKVMINNKWQGEVDGQWVHAYAGAIEQELSQGVLIILEEKNGFVAPGDAEVYQTPAKAGPLSLMGAEGMMLTAKASDGSVWLFDISARQFRSDQ